VEPMVHGMVFEIGDKAGHIDDSQCFLLCSRGPKP
jgi:hypothetical protein